MWLLKNVVTYEEIINHYICWHDMIEYFILYINRMFDTVFMIIKVIDIK
jgi:hypothetical protein